MSTEWWLNHSINKMYAVGVAVTGDIIDGQKDGWMLEGLFTTEEEAVANCLNDDHFVVSIPVGIMTGREIPDGMYWPRLQSKEEGQRRIEEFRKGKLK